MTQTWSKRAGYPGLAWVVTLGVVGVILWRNATVTRSAVSSWLVPLQAQARYLIGLKSLGLPGMSAAKLYEQAEGLIDSSNYSQRLRLAILAGELIGPEEALEELQRLEAEASEEEIRIPSEFSQGVEKLLRELYSGYKKDPHTPVLTLEEQETLRRGLLWFGDLALAPAGGNPEAREKALLPAKRTVLGYFVAGMGFLLGFLSGLGLIVLVVALLLTGRLAGGLPASCQVGGIYAETFALYMVLYVGLGFLARTLPMAWSGIGLSGMIMILSLGALVWPMVRGVSWKQVREDLGLDRGKQLYVELLVGMGTYLTALPVIVVGLLLMFLLMYLGGRFGPGLTGTGPTHPIMDMALEKDWRIWLQVFVVACVLAPIVEEIMFRGVLYRHLRDSSSRWGPRMSVLTSTMLSSFLFAVIHPQGWLGVPVLMGLAGVFCLAREWRGSLVAPIVAHALNNSISVLLLLLMAT